MTQSYSQARQRAAGSDPSERMGDVFEMTRSALGLQQQLLGFASVNIEVMRFLARHTETQLDYLNALAQCRDIGALGRVNAEYAQRFTDNLRDDLQEMARLTSRVMSEGGRVLNTAGRP